MALSLGFHLKTFTLKYKHFPNYTYKISPLYSFKENSFLKKMFNYELEDLLLRNEND